MTTNTADERQAIDTCLSCVLPECIPDHPLCPVSGVQTDLKWYKLERLCTYCCKGILIETDLLLVPFFFQCQATGDNTCGYRSACRWFSAKPEISGYQRRKLTGGLSRATRYHAVHAVHDPSGNTD